MIRSIHKKLATFGIAALCFGYFASYVPYSMMTKMITSGLFKGMQGVGFSGFEIQPVVVFATFVCVYLYLTLAGWWKYATHSKVFGVSVARPQWFTLVSGICLSGQIVTTTLAYTFSGVSIVFAMLLMRGGVLVLAPVVDTVARKRKRKIYWPSWIAALLSLGSVIVAFAGNAGTAITVVASVDIGIYLFVYFFRLYFMSNRAKSECPDEMRRYFTEEQMIAAPFLFLILIIIGLIGAGMSSETIPAKIWQGFVSFPFKGYFFEALLVGMFSFGTGLFGSLIFLDKREHTFCVPANRCSSVVAGVMASYLLAVFYGQRYPDVYEMGGAVLILAAIIFLSYRAIMDKRMKVKAKAKVKADTKIAKGCCCAEEG